MSVSNICLLCLQHSDDLFKIFGKRGIELNTGSTLKEHFWFEVRESDERSICEKCWWTVQNFHDFYNSVKFNHQHQSIFDIKPVIVDANERTEILELFHTFKDEPNIDIENDIKDFSPDISDTPDSPAGESCMEAERNRGTDSQTTKPKKRLRESASGQYKTDSHTVLLSTYFNMSCDLCDVPMSSYRDTMKHYKHVHNVNKGYLICCNKKFFQLSHMLQHCQWHINPDSFKCDHCPKNFSSKSALQQHVNLCHVPEEGKVFNCNYCDDTFSKQAYLNVHTKKWHTSHSPMEGENVCSSADKEQFQCDICKRSFTKSYHLTSHMKVKHLKDEDKQFECYICRKRFVILSYLTGHIKRIHRNAQSHICEVCAKPFMSRNAYKFHYRNVHTKILQKVQCDLCGKWLKHKASLGNHLRWHRKQGKTETCAICGRVSSNVRAHIRNVHREASLECTICGKMFKKQLSLKEHRAIHAGVTDLYKCKFCTKTFRSNANMCSHRKRAHPAELEEEKASQKFLTPATTV